MEIRRGTIQRALTEIEEEITCEGFPDSTFTTTRMIITSTEAIIIAMRTMLNFFLLCGYCSYYSCYLAGDESETWIK